IVDLGIGDGVDTEDGIGMGVEISASDIREDEEEFKAEASARGTMEIAVDPLVTGGIFESTREDVPDLEGTLYDILEAGQLTASKERVGLTDRIRRLGRENLRVEALLCIERDRVDSLRHHMDMTITRFGMTPEAIEELIAQRVAEALANYEATHATNALEAKREDLIERYVRGLSDNIQGNVMSAEPTSLQDAIRLANSLMDQKLKGYTIRSAENKRKF
nr:hypothetical protein [Tanacetum cinerariifolium]